jgi:hypothetical protein
LTSALCIPDANRNQVFLSPQKDVWMAKINYLLIIVKIYYKDNEIFADLRIRNINAYHHKTY